MTQFPIRSHHPRAASLLVIALAIASVSRATADSKPVTLIDNGVAKLPIVAGSVEEPVAELRRYLHETTGVEFATARAEGNQAGIYVGLFKNFAHLQFEQTDNLGPEGFILRTDGRNVYLLAAHPRGVQHAVTTFLHRLGCRWFFPGEAWEIVPRRKTITVNLDERHTPAFSTQRRIWYGFGAYATGRRDHEAWVRHNRMGGPIDVSIGHTWHGLNPEKDFAAHPDWFALVEGKRQPSKPCYSHPAVLARAIESAKKQAARGEQMVSMTPPDGLGYCECKRCLATLKGGEQFRAHRSLFAKKPNGEVVNITSETLFKFVNEVAAAVAKEHPDTLIGCYAYSAYSHPPSFDLHPNVYLQTTTAFRRTPIELTDQLAAFGKTTTQLGIREYYSVYQWDWDYPDPGKMTPAQLAEDLKLFHRSGITAINAEASNNWAARGLGYYVASQLMWDVNADTNAIVRDFYEQAFGPAALPMQRYFARWYGPSVVVLDDDRDAPAKRVLFEKGEFDIEALTAAYRDLDEAARAVPADSAHRRRIDLIRMYAHYLLLRYRLHQAEQAKDDAAILAAIKAETLFGGRLTDTHMIHTRPLLGKAFPRRFRKHENLLKDVDAARKWGDGWRKIGEPPSQKELDDIWQADLKSLGIR